MKKFLYTLLVLGLVACTKETVDVAPFELTSLEVVRGSESSKTLELDIKINNVNVSSTEVLAEGFDYASFGYAEGIIRVNFNEDLSGSIIVEYRGETDSVNFDSNIVTATPTEFWEDGSPKSGNININGLASGATLNVQLRIRN